jgi:hypothetical protein
MWSYASRGGEIYVDFGSKHTSGAPVRRLIIKQEAYRASRLAR